MFQPCTWLPGEAAGFVPVMKSNPALFCIACWEQGGDQGLCGGPKGQRSRWNTNYELCKHSGSVTWLVLKSGDCGLTSQNTHVSKKAKGQGSRRVLILEV